MNFIKTFLITLAIYIGLNAVFLAVSIFISTSFPLDDIFFVVSTLFSPIMSTPGTSFMVAIGLIAAFDLLVFLSFLALIVPPLVAVIVGARLGETGKISFLSWFLTAVISCVVYLLLLILGQDASTLLGNTWAGLQLLFGFIGAILYMIIAGVVNGIFYGCFSYLFSKGSL
ncbi:MAG: hypothetical protein KGD68_14340 [Candidatus Lokiarchaeota archaeon]|nr:hypothetical protein [Candidatus Lokiarchaeota archaeon]